MEYNFETGLLIFSGILNLVLIVILCRLGVERRRQAEHIRLLSGILGRSTDDLVKATEENKDDGNKRT